MITLVSLSLLLFFVTSGVIALAVIYMPADYLVAKPEERLHPLLHLVLKIVKNILGIALVIMGSMLLVLPGQGILTILLGLMLTDFPGRRKIVIRLLRIPAVSRTINLLRKKAGKSPLQFPSKRR
ncbi:MAG: hypothetical protein B6D59_03525 [Campylobacteraceae bacterium 4484_4]|nr:MAG: hypothetical protein B6D59_03525 [Campylobacteraceae bacterium 4484_4]